MRKFGATLQPVAVDLQPRIQADWSAARSRTNTQTLDTITSISWGAGRTFFFGLLNRALELLQRPYLG